MSTSSSNLKQGIQGIESWRSLGGTCEVWERKNWGERENSCKLVTKWEDK